MRFKAAMRDDRHSILAFTGHFGLLQSLVGTAIRLFGKLLGVFPGFCRFYVRNQVRKLFVANLDAAGCVAGLLFGFRGDGGDFVPGPEDFLAGLGDDFYGFHARHFFGRACIDAHDFRVRVRRKHHLGVEHVRAIDIVAVFDAARRLPRTVQARDAPANQAAFVGGRPMIVSHQARPPFMDIAACTTALRTPIYVPQRQRLPPSARFTSSMVGWRCASR